VTSRDPVVQAVSQLVNHHVGVLGVVDTPLAERQTAGARQVVGVVRSAQAMRIELYSPGVLDRTDVETEVEVDVAHDVVEVVVAEDGLESIL